MSIEKVFEANDGHRILGLCISDGPKTCRIMLTWPFDKIGNVVELPTSDVTEVRAIGSVPLREKADLIRT